MKIRSIAITHVRVPLIEPFRISSGAVAEKDAIVVEVRAGEHAGFGESSPMSGSFYSSDTPESCWRDLVDTLIPALIGREFAGPEVWGPAIDGLPGSNFAKAGVETALWDIAAQAEGSPLHELLGGHRTRVESGLAVGLYDDLGQMLRVIEAHLGAGYRRVKLKIEPGRDLAVVAAARQAFGNIPLFVDANGAYGLEHVDTFRRLDEFGLMMFEQPFPGSRLEDLAELQSRVLTPVCLDESLENLDALARAHRLGSFRIANFKIQRVGGFYNALRMDQFCRERQIPAWVGTMPELGIGQAQAVALASLSNFVFPTDVEASLRWYVDDIVMPFIDVWDGRLTLPDGPGLGYTVDPDKIARYAVESRTFSESTVGEHHA